jgi:hypothetical protein
MCSVEACLFNGPCLSKPRLLRVQCADYFWIHSLAMRQGLGFADMFRKAARASILVQHRDRAQFELRLMCVDSDLVTDPLPFWGMNY